MTTPAKKQLNDAELASTELKAGAVILHEFFKEPVPVLTPKTRPWERNALIGMWQNEATKAAKRFIKAGGGGVPYAFLPLWRKAFVECTQAAVNAASNWLAEQFDIGIELQQFSQSEESIQKEVASESGQSVKSSEPTESIAISEQPAAGDSPLGPSGGN